MLNSNPCVFLSSMKHRAMTHRSAIHRFRPTFRHTRTWFQTVHEGASDARTHATTLHNKFVNIYIYRERGVSKLVEELPHTKGLYRIMQVYPLINNKVYPYSIYLFIYQEFLSFFITISFFFIGERPYKCHLPECGRAFIQLSNLQQHLRNHDAQVERAKNRPFHCNICGKGFATESSLRTHTSKVSHVCKHRFFFYFLYV